MKIAGYRDLNTAETDLVAKIQAMGQEIDALIAQMRGVPAPAQINPADGQPLPAKELAIAAPDATVKVDMAVSLDSMALQDQPPVIDQRWLSLAQKQLADGILSLTRAVTQPTSF